MNAIEAVIFVSESPVKEEELRRIFSREDLPDWQATPEEIATALELLKDKYTGFEHAFELKEIGGGLQFLTRKEFGPLIRALLAEKDKKRLSRASLETLSIIAYRQPISKAEIEYIRGVNCDYAIQKLLEKLLIETAGRSDAPGKPLLYKTSTYFMEYFGINTLNDLPKLQEIPADEEAYQEQFRNAFREEPEFSPESTETDNSLEFGGEFSEIREETTRVGTDGIELPEEIEGEFSPGDGQTEEE
jgi:segregation and condensation protein B